MQKTFALRHLKKNQHSAYTVNVHLKYILRKMLKIFFIYFYIEKIDISYITFY